MKISVTGNTRHNKKMIKKALIFFVNALIKKKIRKKLDIKIQLVSKPLESYKGNTIVVGLCKPLTYAATPRKFAIRLNKHEKFAHILQTLAHEVVHVKQYASGKLRPVDWTFMTDIYKWNGKVRDIPYFTSPWEIEARKMEKILYRKFLTVLEEESRQDA